MIDKLLDAVFYCLLFIGLEAKVACKQRKYQTHNLAAEKHDFFFTEQDPVVE